MGRITLFSSDFCPHSKRLKVELEARGIPYTEISVTKFPKKRTDMMQLGQRMSTPQVFFNTRHVGGADETISLLKEWDSDKKRYKSALERFQLEIERYPDPGDARFAVPDYPPVEVQACLPRSDEMSLTLPSGTKASVREVTETLKDIISHSNNRHGRTIFRKSFSGDLAIKNLMLHYDVDRAKAIQFMEQLISERIVHKLAGGKNENDPDSKNTFYRLQCFQTPNVLNSYRIWTERVDANAERLVTVLKELITQKEEAMTDDSGSIDFLSVIEQADFSVFEEAACELQGIDLLHMEDKTKIAFGINLYNLMIKYAFMKVGIPETDYSRFLFFNNVKFNVGGYLFSFQDWENGILRGNRKAPFVVGLQFSQMDPRLALVVKKPDARIHFALNCGAASCPPVRNFSAEHLDEELRIVAISFCEEESNMRIEPDRNQIHLSKVFDWYRIDFAESKNQLSKEIVQYLKGIKRQTLEKMLSKSLSAVIKVVFLEYDWSNNAKTSMVFHAESLKADKSSLKNLVFAG